MNYADHYSNADLGFTPAGGIVPTMSLEDAISNAKYLLENGALSVTIKSEIV